MVKRKGVKGREEEGENENGKPSGVNKGEPGGEREERWNTLSLRIPEPGTALPLAERCVFLHYSTHSQLLSELSQTSCPHPSAAKPPAFPNPTKSTLESPESGRTYNRNFPPIARGISSSSGSALSGSAPVPGLE